MSVFSIEHFLFNLGQSDDLRITYRENPGKVLSEYDLTDKEKTAIKAIDLKWLIDHGVNPLLLLRFNFTGAIPGREAYLKLLRGEDIH